MRPIDADLLMEKFKDVDSDTLEERRFNQVARYFIRHAPTLTQPNEALTVDELREMDGKPVWLDTADGVWTLVDVSNNCVRLNKGERISLDWLSDIAYCCPPEREEDT